MITIVSDGPIKQKEFATLSSIYLKRVQSFPSIRIKHLYFQKDFESRVRDLARKSSHQLYLLSEEGELLTSQEFSEFLRPNFQGSESFTLVIGPPKGFSAELKKECKQISLSPMTFPHEMAQVLLIEQIYRAYCLFSGREYHK